MRPMRRMGGGGGGGFGVFGLETVAARLTLAVLAGSVLYAITQNPDLLLSPASVVYQLKLWQPLSYAFVSPSPIALIFSLLITWQIGGFLEGTWGGRRTALLAVGVPVAAGVLTTLVLVFLVGMNGVFAGGHVLTLTLWVAYGWVIGRGQTSFWFIPVTGNTLALIGIGFVVVQALYGSFWAVLPEVFAVALAFAVVKGTSPRALWARFQHNRMRRNMRKANHLKVVNRSDRDSYLN